MVHCQVALDEHPLKYTDISLLPHHSKTIMPNVAVSQTAVSPTAATSNTKTKKHHHQHHHHHHHHHKHRYHHKKHSINKSELRVPKQVTTTSYASAATILAGVSQITISASRTTAVDSASTVTTEAPYESSATGSNQIFRTVDSGSYFVKETPVSTLFTRVTIATSNVITPSFPRPTSRMLSPPRDHPMRDTHPLSSSLVIPSFVSPSPSIIQPIPAKAITDDGTVSPTPTTTHTNENNDNNNGAYHHKAQIHSSNRDLGLGLGLGFGGFSILALLALLIQNYKKRQRNHSSIRASNHIDNNGVFFTEKPSMFKRKSANGHSRQNSFTVTTRWRPQSFLDVVANVIATRFSKRGSNNSLAHFGESGSVDYDPLTYPQPLYSPVKATYQDM
ncbi:hypothetical protein MBANPS3_004965 [Mucor bainieri]